MSTDRQETKVTSSPTGQNALDWLKRLGLRWAIAYFVIYIFVDYTFVPFLTYQPGLEFFGWIAGAQNTLWNAVVPWVAAHIVGHPIHAVPNEGERWFEYIEDGIVLVSAFVVALVWTCLDRGRERERKLYEFTRILVRYTLAITLIWYYGFPKLFPCGFFPCLESAFLMQPFGDMPARAFMFFFFGYSSLYSFLIGSAEVVGGVFVLFRRTTTLGALILAGVLTNVVVMDAIYGIDVRRFSANLALMAIFLLAPDAIRIVRVILGYGATPSDSSLNVTPKALRIGSILAKVAFFGWGLLWYVPSSLPGMAMLAASHNVPLGGYYQVDAFQRNNSKRSSTQSQEPVWEMAAIDGTPRYAFTTNRGAQPVDLYQVLHVRTTTSAVMNYLLQIRRIDGMHGVFSLVQCGNTDYRCLLVVQQTASPKVIPKNHAKPIFLQYVITKSSPQPGSQGAPNNEVLTLTGTINGAKVSIRLRHLAESPFQLERSAGSGINLIDPDDYLWTT